MKIENQAFTFLVDEALREAGRTQAGTALVRLVDQLFGTAATLGASDLHIEPRAEAVHLRYRVDGVLREPLPPLPIALHASLTARLKVMAGMDITGHQLPQDGHITHLGSGEPVDVRVSSLPGTHGEILVLRFLARDDRLLSLDELGFTPENLALFRTLIHGSAGLVIITGPMNSGKSTTLYAAIAELADPGTSIVTLEDPVERQLPGICQVQMNERVGLTYPVALRALLRQDAEKILLGEIRDEKTAEMAVRIALTGHLVLTTLHTEDTATAIARLREMGIPPYLLAATLRGIVSQRLVRRLCPQCREKAAGTRPSPPRYRSAPPPTGGGIGCETCHGTGYAGRIALHEILPVTPAIRQSILDGAPTSAIRDIQCAAGLPTLETDARAKIAANLTTATELHRVL